MYEKTRWPYAEEGGEDGRNMKYFLIGRITACDLDVFPIAGSKNILLTIRISTEKINKYM